jgi:hypothetical protein
LPVFLQTLLITDSLFRTTDLRRRKKCVALVDEVTAGALLSFPSILAGRVAGQLGGRVAGCAALMDEAAAGG